MQSSILVKLKARTGECFSFVDRKHWRCFLLCLFLSPVTISAQECPGCGWERMSSLPLGWKIKILSVSQPNLMELKMRCLSPFIILILPEYSSLLYSVNISIYKARPSGGRQQLFCLMFNGFLSLWTLCQCILLRTSSRRILQPHFIYQDTLHRNLFCTAMNYINTQIKDTYTITACREHCLQQTHQANELLCRKSLNLCGFPGTVFINVLALF